MSNKRICAECKNELMGRADQKFCNDACRNAYNNRLNSDQNLYMKEVNAILRRNRRILEQAIKPANETIKISKSKLIEKGFSFNYFTNQTTTKKGSHYFFVYEYGYLWLEHDYILIVKRIIE